MNYESRAWPEDVEVVVEDGFSDSPDTLMQAFRGLRRKSKAFRPFDQVVRERRNSSASGVYNGTEEEDEEELVHPRVHPRVPASAAGGRARRHRRSYHGSVGFHESVDVDFSASNNSFLADPWIQRSLQ